MNADNMNQYAKTGSDEERDETKRNFALLSHDLRASLAGVLGSLDLIDTTDLSKDAQANLARARASSRMLQELMELAFDMGEDLTYPANSGDPVNVAAELEVIADIWLPQVGRDGTGFSLDIPENLPLLDTTDKVSFHRIINNLIGNAIKFSTRGEVRVSVAYANGETMRIEISDTGPGFSDAAKAGLFQFRSRPEDSDKPGSGMGLYIVSTLVRGMGGAISARNRPGGGAQVTLTFPVRQHHQASRFAGEEPLPDLSHYKILLAEDNITNQLVVTQMLKSMGARFEVASDGVEALEIFEREDFDVVLLDIEMPRKSGLEVLRAIRARTDAKSATPLVALTAYVMREHRDRIEMAGADGIIAKPIEGISALGRSILGFMYGSAPQITPVPEAANTLSGFQGDVGEVDRQVFDTLMQTIGAETREDFLEKVTIDLQDMRTNLIEAEAAGDSQAIRAASHTLISVGGSIGAANLQQCAEALNLAVKADGQINRQSLNMLCIKGISEVLAFLAKQ